MEKKTELIKSPLNYTGGKFKLLSKILPYFPKDINTFIDLFGGGFNVGINVEAKRIIYNDILTQVVDLLHYFYETPLQNTLDGIDSLINTYDLSKTNREGYLSLREHYNTADCSPVVFYTLICYSFNNQIRFNSKQEFNVPFGKDRSSFNEALREKLKIFITEMQKKIVVFSNQDFYSLKIDKLKKDDFVYLDPPYLNTTATYNEKSGWGLKEEELLRSKIVELHNQGIRFGLSNNAEMNSSLISWAEDNGFSVIHLDHNYNNCNYHKKEENKKNDEVYITNYYLKENINE